MSNLVKGIQKIRRSYNLVKDESKAVSGLEANKDADVKAVVKAFDGTPSQLLKKCKAIKGSVTDKTIKELGLKTSKSDAKAKSETKVKKEVKPKAKAVKKKKDSDDSVVEESDKEVEIQLVTPKSVTCPDDDGKGHEVVLVVGKDGLFGCGVLGNQPSD